MPKYEIPNNVKDNILKLIDRVDIKGGEAPVIIQIIQTLSAPVIDRKKKEDDKNEKSNEERK